MNQEQSWKTRQEALLLAAQHPSPLQPEDSKKTSDEYETNDDNNPDYGGMWNLADPTPPPENGLAPLHTTTPLAWLEKPAYGGNGF
mgnify:CR=1 FL=1